MRCAFCATEIHFYEEFFFVKGYYFHIQLLTYNNTVRCKRIHNKLLEGIEKKILDTYDGEE